MHNKTERASFLIRNSISSFKFISSLDLLKQETTRRLSKKALEMPLKVEQLLLGVINNDFDVYSSVIQHVTKFYSSDISEDKLKREIALVPDMMTCVKQSKDFKNLKTVTSVTTICDILSAFPDYAKLFSDYVKLLRIFLTIPVSTATAERSFSALRRLKTYLRSTMGQERLSRVVVLNSHKDFTDKIEILEVAQRFVEVEQTRKMYFGSFVA